MTNLNTVMLIGRLTKDGELSYTKGGTPLLKLSLAVNKSMKQQDGTYKDNVSYFDLVVWGKYGETMAKHCLKGKQLGIQGELEQQRWQDQSGANKSRVTVNVRNMELLADPKGGQSSPAQHQEPPAQEQQAGDNYEQFQDDIPF